MFKRWIVVVIVFSFYCISVSAAQPVFYVSIDGAVHGEASGGGLYKIETDSNTVVRIDQTGLPNGDFVDISTYGNNQLMVSKYGAGTIYILNLDGSVAREFTGLSNPISCVEDVNGTGNIYYTDYFDSSLRLYNVTDGTDSLVADFSDRRIMDVAQRSNGNLYVTPWQENIGIRQASNGQVLENNGQTQDINVDAYDNLFRLGGYTSGTYGNGSHSVIKLDSDDNESIFWQDSNILLYNFNYSKDEDCYYGIGIDGDSKINIYKFSKEGDATLYQADISGFTGGYHGLLAYSNIYISNIDTQATITLTPDNTAPVIGDTLCVDVDIADAGALYSAAFDLTYNPVALQYQSASEGGFLNSDGEATFFEASLLNGEASSGIVVVGVSRVAASGEVSGSGTIASICFSVIGGSGSDISIGLDNGYFEGADQGTSIDVVESEDPVIPVEVGIPTNLAVTDPGTLDQLNLSWDAAPDASGYEVYRANTSGGTFELLGTATGTTYADSNCILVGAAYFYKIKALAASGSSTGEFSSEASGTAAGLAGDINKDNRVDGRDLTILARAFGSASGGSDYQCQANLDRMDDIDGDDLVILTTNFGDRL